MMQCYTWQVCCVQVFLLCAQVVQVLGAMGLLGIHLSAITGVMVTVSLGLTIDFMTHIGVVSSCIIRTHLLLNNLHLHHSILLE